MDLFEREREFKRCISDGTRSLLMSGFLLSDEERARIRDLPSPRQNCWYHLQLAVFLYDFFFESDGGSYTNLQSPIATCNLRDGLDYVWKEVYGCGICENEDEPMRRLRSIKSKCWILREGPTSDVWKRLRDIVHFAKDNDADIESRCDVTDRDFFRLVDLLADGARADNIQQWQNNVPPEEFEVWRMWVKFCNSHLNLSQTAYVDWYLQFDEGGQLAQYVAGFDGFPDEEGEWRSFEISDQGRVGQKRIPTSSSWAEPIPWNRNVSIKYNAKNWDTLKPNDRGQQVGADESCFFHSENEHISVFVRYRSSKKDTRRNWWKRYDWDEQPELGSGQSDLLICGRDSNAISRLKLTSESNWIEWKLDKSGEFYISNENEEPVKIPFRIYSITNRPNDADVEIAICDGDREIRRIKVRGNSAHATIDAGGNGFFVKSRGRDSHCLSLSGTMNLKVELPRESNEYKWTLFINGVEQWSSTCREVTLTLQEVPALRNVNSITPFTLRCEESAGTGHRRIIGRTKGVIIPDGIAHYLCGEGGGAEGGEDIQLERWNIEDVLNGDVSTIADRIEGFRRVKIRDPEGVSFEIGVPDTGFKWWFEDGHNSFMDMQSAPALLDEDSQVQEFSAEDIRNKSLCLPPDIQCDLREWTLSSSYFRRRVDSLIDVSNFRYDPNPQLRSYRFSGSEIDIFRYRFEPKSARLCSDVNGRLGVYIPANDHSEYVAVAFSDVSAELLLQGRVIARICPSNRFTDIQDAWNSFCQDAEEHDALLAILEAKDGHDFITMCTKAIKDKFDERLLLRKSVEECMYGDKELSTVKALKNLLGNIPEDHPVREMHFFRTMQTQTYEQVKNGWRSSVETLITGRCIDSGVWNNLFSEWLQSGFYPLIEGVAQEIFSQIKSLFMKILFSSDFENVDQSSDEWKSFIVRCLDTGLRMSEDDIRNLSIWPDGFRRTQHRMNAFLGEVNEHCRIWNDFKEKCIRQTFGVVNSDRRLVGILKDDIRRQYNITDEWLLGKICYRAELNNNVGEREMTMPVLNKSPMNLFKSIIQEQNESCLVLRMFEGLLNRMAEKRKVANFQSNRSTDREWLFCLAAATVLLNENIEMKEDVRDVLAQILREIRNNDGARNKFMNYQGICRSVQEICNQI